VGAPDYALFLWAIDPMLPQALDVTAAWGFTFKTVAFYWAKRCRASDGWHIGTGYWSRANPEQCLRGTRGSPMRLSRSVRRLVVAPVREHSRKPDEVAQSIQQLVPGPYLEMFARERRFGWDAWGNESEKFSEVPTLLQAA